MAFLDFSASFNITSIWSLKFSISEFILVNHLNDIVVAKILATCAHPPLTIPNTEPIIPSDSLGILLIGVLLAFEPSLLFRISFCLAVSR